MSLKFVILFFFVFLSTQSFAQTDNTKQEEPTFLDSTHQDISEMVVNLSDAIDDRLNFGEYKSTQVFKDDTSVDSFFQNKKFLEETDNAYIRVRAKSLFQSKDSTDTGISVRASVPLSKTRKSLKLFIKSFDDDEMNEMTTQNADDMDFSSAPTVGVSYLTPKTYGIKSKYRLGIRNTSPYVQARYSKKFNTDEWAIEPVQSFVYSVKNDFLEETNIYFDKHLGDRSLFRVQLYRGTQSRLDGMNYGLSLSRYRTINSRTGINFSQSFAGNTKYRYATNDTTIPVTMSKTYGGLNNYATSVNWRQNVWKKWFYYEVRPSVNFARQYDYKANYSLLINLDFYFGRFGKR